MVTDFMYILSTMWTDNQAGPWAHTPREGVSVLEGQWAARQEKSSAE